MSLLMFAAVVVTAVACGIGAAVLVSGHLASSGFRDREWWVALAAKLVVAATVAGLWMLAVSELVADGR